MNNVPVIPNFTTKPLQRPSTSIGDGMRSPQDMMKVGEQEIVARIEDQWPEEGAVFIFGKEGSMKTTLAMSHTLNIAEGKDALGVWVTERCKAMHMNFEDADIPFGKKFGNLYTGMGSRCKSDDYAIPPYIGSINILKDDDYSTFTDWVRDAGVKVIVIDAYKDICSVGSYDDKGNQKVIDRIKRVALKYHVLFIIIDHENKSGGKMGGFARKYQSADVVMQVELVSEYPEPSIASVTVRKNKFWQSDKKGYWVKNSKPYYFERVLTTDDQDGPFFLRMSDGTAKSCNRAILKLIENTGCNARPVIHGSLPEFREKEIDNALKELVGLGKLIPGKEPKNGRRGARQDIYTLSKVNPTAKDINLEALTDKNPKNQDWLNDPETAESK